MTDNELIKKARIEAGLTQTELGRRIQRSRQWVSELERGNIRLSYESARDIAAALGTTPDAILFIGESITRPNQEVS